MPPEEGEPPDCRITRPSLPSLIAAIVGGIVLAFLFGAAANRLRISPLIGYLLGGVAVGPFTPGFVADQELACATLRKAGLASETPPAPAIAS